MASARAGSPARVASGGLPSAGTKLDAPPVPKPYRMNFLRRSKVTKSDKADDDEAEIKRLEKKLSLLQKKKQLVTKIKKIERGIKTGEPDSDDDTTFSPNKSKLFKMKRWMRCETNEDSSEDDISFEADDSTSPFSKFSDCIQDTCSPTSIINNLADFHYGLEAAFKYKSPEDSDESVKLLSNDNCPREKATAIRQSFDQNASQPNVHMATKERDGPVGWMDMATDMLRSQTFPQMSDVGNDFGHDIFKVTSREPIDDTPTEPSKELHAKFAQITVTALALTGLSIKTKVKSQGKEEHPPVRIVLSVMKNDTTSETKPFINIPSLRVVKDPSQEELRKKNSIKYNVMGVWDIASAHEQTRSTVSFSKLVGLTSAEGDAQTEPTDINMPPSTIHLRVCIKRDDSEELLPIGVAKVLISSPRDRQLAIPLRPEYYRSMEELVKKLNAKPPESKWESLKTFVLEDEEEILTCARFKGFKNETYRLENDSLLRLNVTVTPEAQAERSWPFDWAPYPLLNAFLSMNATYQTTAEELKDGTAINLSESPGAADKHPSSSHQIRDYLDDAKSTSSLSIKDIVDDQSNTEEDTLYQDLSFSDGDPKSTTDPLDTNSDEGKDQVDMESILLDGDPKPIDGDIIVSNSRKSKSWFKRKSVSEALEQNNVSTITEYQRYHGTKEKEFQRSDDETCQVRIDAPPEGAIETLASDLGSDCSQNSFHDEVIHILPDSTPLKSTEQQVDYTNMRRSWFKKVPPISDSKATEVRVEEDDAQSVSSEFLAPSNEERAETSEPPSPAQTGIELELC